MKVWFQVVLAVGILSLGLASLTYSWRTYRIYKAERAAELACVSLYKNEAFATPAEEIIALQQCVSATYSPHGAASSD